MYRTVRLCLCVGLCRWNHFEVKYLSWLLLKPSARRGRDHLFHIFHQLNLKDAVSYVKEVGLTPSCRVLGLKPQ